MSIKALRVDEKFPNRYYFDVSDANFQSMNEMRKYCLRDMKTLAFTKVEIMENTSMFTDEIIEERVKLVPLKFDKIDKVEACTQLQVKSNDFTHNNSAKFELKIHNNKKKNNVINVFADDLKLSDEAIHTPKIAFPDSVLLVLKSEEIIHLVAYAIIGVGDDHPRFLPVSITPFYSSKCVWDLTNILLTPEEVKLMENIDEKQQDLFIEKHYTIKSKLQCDEKNFTFFFECIGNRSHTSIYKELVEKFGKGKLTEFRSVLDDLEAE